MKHLCLAFRCSANRGIHITLQCGLGLASYHQGVHLGLSWQHTILNKAVHAAVRLRTADRGSGVFFAGLDQWLSSDPDHAEGSAAANVRFSGIQEIAV